MKHRNKETMIWVYALIKLNISKGADTKIQEPYFFKNKKFQTQRADPKDPKNYVTLTIFQLNTQYILLYFHFKLDALFFCELIIIS